jgi:hypothetical protein
LLKPKKVAPNTKSCSKVAEHNRDMPRRAEKGAESEGQWPEDIFKFRVSEMPFPGLWGRFDRILMVRKQHFSMSKFTI